MGTFPPLSVEQRRRTTALVLGDDDRVVTDDPILLAAADAPNSWPNVVPLIAAEALRVASAADVSSMVTALLDALTTE